MKRWIWNIGIGFIFFVTLCDILLSYEVADVLKEVELNPVGRELIELTDGKIHLFMFCRGYSTVFGIVTLYLLRQYKKTLSNYLLGIWFTEQLIVLTILLK